LIIGKQHPLDGGSR